MSDPAITVENVSKRFRLGQDAGYSRLSESIQSSLFGWLRSSEKAEQNNSSNEQDLSKSPQEFWALKEITFDVQPGEALGIIGRNGAGKSTLLKLLSRITRPTSGRIGTRGRVGSLLEVGTGFHPELTGRENVFLNGSILGMKRSEIMKRFDEIVSFAELEGFIDTPVKRYSSGMYARLAFAVAAHLEPEILIIDEVLAVGDAAFQKRCLGKMGDVANQGRTVLFVSHNMMAIKTLCQRALVLEQGKIVNLGDVEQSIERYLGLHDSHAKVPVVTFDKCTHPLETISVNLLRQDKRVNQYSTGDEIVLEVRFKAQAPVQQFHIGFELRSQQGECVIASSSRYQTTTHFSEPTRDGKIKCSLGMVPLMPGNYSFSFWFGIGHEETDIFHHALAFEMIEKNIWETATVPGHKDSRLWWPTQFAYSSEESNSS